MKAAQIQNREELQTQLTKEMCLKYSSNFLTFFFKQSHSLLAPGPLVTLVHGH
jgi:hypothetical protein